MYGYQGNATITDPQQRRVRVQVSTAYEQEVRVDPFLLEVAQKLDSYQGREDITPVMDELEYLFDALEGEEQDACAQLISLLQKRLSEVS